MFSTLYEFFGLVGVDLEVPLTFSDFIPWFIVAIVGVFIVGFVFRMFQYFCGLVMGRGKKY